MSNNLNIQSEIFKLLNGEYPEFKRKVSISDYVTPMVSNSTIQMNKRANSNLIYFKLNNGMSGNIKINITGFNTSNYKVYDIYEEEVSTLTTGYYDVLMCEGYFVLLNKEGLSESTLSNYNLIQEVIDNILSNDETTIIDGKFIGLLKDSVTEDKLSPGVRSKLSRNGVATVNDIIPDSDGNVFIDTMTDEFLEYKVEVNTKLDDIGNNLNDFDSWTDLSEYIASHITTVPNENSRGNVKVILPPGDFYINEVDIFENFTRRTSGVTFVGAGRTVTRIHFDPPGNNEYLFENNDKLLHLHFEDIGFLGNPNKNTNFMLSISNGGAQNYTFDRCNFRNFDKVFDLQGNNNNSEFTFKHCGFYGIIRDGVLFVGDQNTSTSSDQFLNYNFIGCQFEVYEGNFVNMKYGGNVNVIGGSFIHIPMDNENSNGGTFFKLRTPSHSYGVCRLLVMGVRFEHRNRNSKLIECEWRNGNIEFLNCDMDCYSKETISKDWITAKFSGLNTFPSIKFDNCSLLGKHLYVHNTEGVRAINSIVYQSCLHNLLDSITDLFVYETIPSTNFYNHGSRPAIHIKNFRTSGNTDEVFDTTLNKELHGKAIVDKKVLFLNNTNGSLPNRNGVITAKLPINSIITKVTLYCPSGAVTSGYTVKYRIETNETNPTVLIDMAPDNIRYRDGFEKIMDGIFICDTEEKRTIKLMDLENIDQTTIKGLCMIEYI